MAISIPERLVLPVSMSGSPTGSDHPPIEPLPVFASWLAEEWAALGLEFRTRGVRLEESLEICQRLWRDQTVEHHGECFVVAPWQRSRDAFAALREFADHQRLSPEKIR